MDLFLLELTVADWDASVAWYRDCLALPVSLSDNKNRYALFAAGPARIALKEGVAASGGVVFTFHVPSLDAELARLAGNGVVPVRPVRVSAEGYRVAEFADPDGHRLAVFEWLRPNPVPPPGG